MKLTRERKIGGAVLGLALAAFCVDRMMGPSTDDSSAVATDAAPLLLATATTPVPHVASITSGNDAPSLAQRLATVASSTVKPGSDSRDLFRLSSKWSADSAAARANNVRQAADTFAQTHKLTAISRGAGNSGSGNSGAAAMIDGKLVHVGASLDGFKLISVSKTSAAFDCNGQQVQLMLKSDGSAR